MERKYGIIMILENLFSQELRNHLEPMKKMLFTVDSKHESAQPDYFVVVDKIGDETKLQLSILIIEVQKKQIVDELHKLTLWMKSALEEWNTYLKERDLLTKDNLNKIVVHGALVDDHNIRFFQARTDLKTSTDYSCPTKDTPLQEFQKLNLDVIDDCALCMSHVFSIRKYFHFLKLEKGESIERPRTIDCKRAENMVDKVYQTFKIITAEQEDDLFKEMKEGQWNFESKEEAILYIERYSDMVVLGEYINDALNIHQQMSKATHFIFKKDEDCVFVVEKVWDQICGIVCVSQNLLLFEITRKTPAHWRSVITPPPSSNFDSDGDEKRNNRPQQMRSNKDQAASNAKSKAFDGSNSNNGNSGNPGIFDFLLTLKTSKLFFRETPFTFVCGVDHPKLGKIVIKFSGRKERKDVIEKIQQMDYDGVVKIHAYLTTTESDMCIIKQFLEKFNISCNIDYPKIVLIDFNNSSLEGKISGVYKFPYTHPLNEWKYTRVADLYACGIVIYGMVNEIYCEERPIDVSTLQHLGDLGARNAFLKFGKENDPFLDQVSQLVNFLLSIDHCAHVSVSQAKMIISSMKRKRLQQITNNTNEIVKSVGQISFTMEGMENKH